MHLPPSEGMTVMVSPSGFCLRVSRSHDSHSGEMSLTMFVSCLHPVICRSSTVSRPSFAASRIALRTVVSAPPAITAMPPTERRQSFRRGGHCREKEQDGLFGEGEPRSDLGRHLARGDPSAAAFHASISPWPRTAPAHPGMCSEMLRSSSSSRPAVKHKCAASESKVDQRCGIHPRAC